MAGKIRRIGILTGGGDCPGLNAVIRAVSKMAMLRLGIEVIGIEDGFEGLVENRMHRLQYEEVSGILALGGTILGTSNKANPFEYKLHGCSGEDRSDDALRNCEAAGIEMLICIGGDGTLSIANRFREKGLPVVGVPKTIDNDLDETDLTFGFDSAVSVGMEAIDSLHTTAQSHHRVMVVEMMGRYAGWLALTAGVAGGGDVILIPELPFEMDKVFESVQSRAKRGKRFSIVVVAEGARPKGGDVFVERTVSDSPDPIRLGGIGKHIGNEIEKATGIETRTVVLGHLQRGGSPTAFDRILATRFGTEAARLVAECESGKMVRLKDGKVSSVEIEKAVARLKLVPPDHPLIDAARAVGTCFCN